MRPRLRISSLVLSLGCLVPVLAAAAPVVGRLASPAGAVPALTVYAWSLTGARLFSVSTESGQATYTMELPAGRYYVFAAPLDPGAPAVYGAYTEFAACTHDGHGGCTAHALKPLVVARRAVAGVDLTDWYLDDAATHELDGILERTEAGTPPESELAAPRFSEYPAAPSLAPRATALAAGNDPRLERDREPLTAALASNFNFAGRTVLVRIGCGDGCETIAFVDAPSGRVAYPELLARLPPAPACASASPLQFRRDSRLLLVTGVSGKQRVTRYFAWDPESGQLRLVASLASVLEERCAPAR